MFFESKYCLRWFIEPLSAKEEAVFLGYAT
jgi:hypothetical protein